MGKRWVPIDRQQSVRTKARYTRAEVEQILRNAARAAGVDEAKLGPIVRQLLPGNAKLVAKSAREVEAERAARQAQLESDLERERVHQITKMRDGGDRLSRMLARDAVPAQAPVVFEQQDGSETTYAGDGAVTRLDLTQPVTKQRSGLFGAVVDAAPTEPYRPR